MTGAVLDRLASQVAKRVEQQTKPKRGEVSAVKGAEPVRVLSEPGAYPRPLQIVPTGLAGLDDAIGLGGWPLGVLIEVYGPESVGKSTLSKYLGARLQANGVTPYFGKLEGVEGSLTFDQALGIVVEGALGSQPNSAEEALITIIEMARGLATIPHPGFLVLDSIGGLVTKAALGTPLSRAEAPGNVANLLKRAIPRALQAIKGQPIGILVVNQVRENIGAGPYAPKYRTPGGMALKHFAHLRLEMSRVDQIREGDEVVGIRSRIRVVKSKISRPYRSCVIEIRFEPFTVRDAVVVVVNPELSSKSWRPT